MPSDAGPLTSLSIRSLMQGKEVGSIIGKGGEIVKSFREESGARINISAGATPERVVAVTGTTDQVFNAYKLITAKVEESVHGGGGSLTIKLIVPASQCGNLIGKGGCKIKELRDDTGATIQVAKEMLPNSTDRTVTLSGSSDNITHCIERIGYVMLESPPKGAHIPYEPDGKYNSLAFNQGNFGLNAGNFGGNFNQGPFGGRGGFGGPGLLGSGGQTLGGPGSGANSMPLGKLANSSLMGLLRGLGNLTGSTGADALAALASAQTSGSGITSGTTTHEMAVPNDQVGSVIGKGGTKIAEIRHATGAMITISKYIEGSEEASKQERTITIKGTADQVALAQYLIQNR